MSTDANKAIAQRWADELWNRGNFAATPELVTADFISHGAGRDRDHEGVVGREAHDRWIRGNRERVPDFHVVFNDLFADGDRVAGRWTVEGTIAASGDHTQTTGIHIYRFSDGKIAEMWNEAHSVS